MRTAIVLILFGCGCYGPDPAKIRITCDSDTGCQSGMTCQAGFCQPIADLAIAPGLMDAAAPDLLGDLATPTSFCAAGGGFGFGPKTSGCPGTFSAGGADAVCKNPAKPCASSTGLDLLKCNGTSGFFLGNQPGYWLGTKPSEACGAAASNQIFFGCGAGGRAGVAKCGGFDKVVDVGTSLTSTTGQLKDTSNTDPAQGVLCCLP